DKLVTGVQTCALPIFLPVGTAAPEWVLKDPNDRSHRLSDYKGKVVLMDFWAVWCIPCHRAMPWLEKVHADLSKRGVVVVGISTEIGRASCREGVDLLE